MSNGKALIERCWAALNSSDVDGFRECFSNEYLRHADGTTFDRDQFADIMSARLSAFPDLQTEIIEVIADGDRLAFRWRSVGTHSNIYLGIPPTGKRITTTGITMSRTLDDRIIEDHTSWNMFGVLHSLGVFPVGSMPGAGLLG